MQGDYAQGCSSWLASLLRRRSSSSWSLSLTPFLLRAIQPEKGTPFECGMDPAGEPWTAPRPALLHDRALFVLFDAEAILLFAVASGMRGHLNALVEVGAFVVFLALGLAYAWRKGALEWRS